MNENQTDWIKSAIEHALADYLHGLDIDYAYRSKHLDPETILFDGELWVFESTKYHRPALECLRKLLRDSWPLWQPSQELLDQRGEDDFGYGCVMDAADKALHAIFERGECRQPAQAMAFGSDRRIQP